MGYNVTKTPLKKVISAGKNEGMIGVIDDS
jgi:hypothetical protein